jgi:hypothetical protein
MCWRVRHFHVLNHSFIHSPASSARIFTQRLKHLLVYRSQKAVVVRRRDAVGRHHDDWTLDTTLRVVATCLASQAVCQQINNAQSVFSYSINRWTRVLELLAGHALCYWIVADVWQQRPLARQCACLLVIIGYYCWLGYSTWYYGMVGIVGMLPIRHTSTCHVFERYRSSFTVS